MLTALFGLLVQAARWVLSQIVAHVRVCLYIFDPVYDVPQSVTNEKSPLFAQYRLHRSQQAEANFHRYFILPILIGLYMFSDLLWILHRNEWDYWGKSLPELITHRMYPMYFAEFGDMLVLFAVIGYMCMGFGLWQRNWLQDRYAMYLVYESEDEQASFKLIVNGKEWDKANAQLVFNFRAKAKKFVGYLACFSYLDALIYFQYHYWSKTQGRDWKYYFEGLGILPITIWYFMLEVLLMFYHFYVVSRYVQLKQRHQLNEQKQLNGTLDNAEKRTSVGFPLLWRQFLAINHDIAYQCAEIRGYNQFWSYILTIQFACQIIDFVYLLYCLLYQVNTFDQTVYLVSFVSEIGGLIFAVTYRCSMVDYYNDRFYAENVKSCILFQLHFDRLLPRQLANIEKIGTNRNFSKSCFRLSNGYRLDSTAFNMVIYFISTFFQRVRGMQHRPIFDERLP